jgi:hypothetical protein
MELVICHDEVSLNSIRNIKILNEIINIATNIVAKVNFGLTRNSLHLINAMINSNAKTVIS